MSVFSELPHLSAAGSTEQVAEPKGVDAAGEYMSAVIARGGHHLSIGARIFGDSQQTQQFQTSTGSNSSPVQIWPVSAG